MAFEKKQLDEIVLGGGCFWCLEAVYSKIKGVQSAISGYAGGETDNPTYEQVLSGKTGHAEVVRIRFDNSLISTEDILRIFFILHDPTTLNRQENDIGTQYRSIILYKNRQQHDIAERIIRETAENGVYGEKMIVTEMKKLEKFYLAEEYHQNYFSKNPEKIYCQLVISPKIAKIRNNFANYFK